MCGAQLRVGSYSEPLRKSRSLANFAKLGADWRLSEDGTPEERSLRRRICSVEDLVGLGGGKLHADPPTLQELLRGLTGLTALDSVDAHAASADIRAPAHASDSSLAASARYGGEGSCESISTTLLPLPCGEDYAIHIAAAHGPVSSSSSRHVPWSGPGALRVRRGSLDLEPPAAAAALASVADAPFIESAAPMRPRSPATQPGSPALSSTPSDGGSSGGGSAPRHGSLLAGLLPYGGGPSASASSPRGPSPCPSFGSLPGSDSAAADALAESHLSESYAAEELFYRLNHARQTVDFVKLKAATYSSLDRLQATVWEALDILGEQREYEAALAGGRAAGLDPDMPLPEHALQTAAACALAFPDHEWAPLVGLISGLGKLLANPRLGPEPQWAVCGESFPVGCRFSPAVAHSQLFTANPDRRRRCYSTDAGVYTPGCGLEAVRMSWGAPEYLYLVLAMNRTALPREVLFLLRHQKFYALTRPGGAYSELLSPADRALLPMLRKFQALCRYRRLDLPDRLAPEAERARCDALLAKYVPLGTLRW